MKRTKKAQKKKKINKEEVNFRLIASEEEGLRIRSKSKKQTIQKINFDHQIYCLVWGYLML